MYPVESAGGPFDGERATTSLERRDRRRASTSCWRGPAPRLGRRAGVPARRARDPRGRRAPAQAPSRRGTSRCCRCSRACRQPSRTRVFDAAQRAPHRAGHQRRRDLAHRARHPLRDRRRHWRASSATASAARSSSCRSSRSARRRPTSAPAAAAAWPTASASACTTRQDFAGAAALHRSGDPALVAGRRDPAHEVAATWARSRTFPFLEPPPRARSPTATSCCSELGAVDDAQRADADRAASWRGCRSTRASAA